jgi:hypothetical protein
LLYFAAAVAAFYVLDIVFGAATASVFGSQSISFAPAVIASVCTGDV